MNIFLQFAIKGSFCSTCMDACEEKKKGCFFPCHMERVITCYGPRLQHVRMLWDVLNDRCDLSTQCVCVCLMQLSPSQHARRMLTLSHSEYWLPVVEIIQIKSWIKVKSIRLPSCSLCNLRKLNRCWEDVQSTFSTNDNTISYFTNLEWLHNWTCGCCSIYINNQKYTH